MEYEKKNKDAISTIKQALRQLSTNGVPVGNIIKAIKDIEEKYAESDDESIRGNIIATIHLYYGEPLEDEAKEMIAWLEKQGEQKIKTPEESLGIDSDTYNKIVDECIYGEQKPAALSEEDVKALNRISTILVDASEVKNWWKEYRLIERDEMIRLNDFLKSLIDRYTWKPSEEQMRTLEHYMHTLVCTKYKEILFGLYSDLKKLRGE